MSLKAIKSIGASIFWLIHFQLSQQVIEQSGGEVVYHHYLGEKETLLAFDSYGADFYLSQA